MRDRAGLEGLGTLRVTVEVIDSVERSFGIRWALMPADARRRFECARIFLVALGDEAQRAYLDIVDGQPSTSVRLPDTLAAGEYAIEVDAYGSASWGDGRLEARGRSDSFTVAGESSASSGPVRR
ncbi:hypothetical protein HLB23_40025 [Nocardia uniformis]|uniref:Uncharacterized protein n=1 Tax=Nocardia uniformis TaxID=53432 RepID=A0A849CAV4_9NOCA|nr:hypothetical protein [Nocardia uniformis]NNH75973.1 hypothetical protein [Nocardia uniformis]